MFAFAESVFGLCSAAPGLADTIRATPVTSWKSLSVTGGSAKASGKTQGHKKAYMSSDGVWHSQANYIFTVAGHKKTDRGGYGKIDASVFLLYLSAHAGWKLYTESLKNRGIRQHWAFGWWKGVQMGC